jgi:hypothetical protein
MADSTKLLLVGGAAAVAYWYFYLRVPEVAAVAAPGCGAIDGGKRRVAGKRRAGKRWGGGEQRDVGNQRDSFVDSLVGLARCRGWGGFYARR